MSTATSRTCCTASTATPARGRAICARAAISAPTVPISGASSPASGKPMSAARAIPRAAPARGGFRRAFGEYGRDMVLSGMSRGSRFCPEGDFVHVARLGGYYDLKSYRRCDHLIFNTRDLVASFIARGWPAERAHYLPNFVDAAPAPPLAREKLATPDEVPLALALGRLHENKGFDVLLAALAETPALPLCLPCT